MWWSTLILATVLGAVSAAIPHSHYQLPEYFQHEEPIKPYQGPPAPLNPDGTVAYTQEFHEVASQHHAMHADEYKRLQETAAFAAANPDKTSPPGKDSYDDGSYREQQEPAYYHQGRFRRAAAPVDDGYILPVRFIEPAPLNHDGTVAFTQEYAAMAAHLQAAHHHNHAQQLEILQRQEEIAKAAGPDKENYDAPAAAPYHQAAPVQYSRSHAPVQQLHQPVYRQPLSAAPISRPLIKAAPAATRPRHPAPIYESSDAAQPVAHRQQYKYAPAAVNRISSAYPAKPYQGPGAPLNDDGTVAHTPEYLAIASAHLSGRYRREAAGPYDHHEQRYHGPPAPLNHDGTVAYSPEYQEISEYNRGAAADERSALIAGYAKAAESHHEALQRHHEAAAAHSAAHERQLAALAKQEELARAAGPDHPEPSYQTEHQYHP